ncbi:MAG: N-acetylmuramoyl-L-alanine amidase [Roseburia sp.]|nr:N-acetylmuramoyl-L-alanine amidase [Roseburia sp.]
MQQNRLMKRTAIYTCLFTVCALASIFYYSTHKLVVIADVAQDEVVQSTQGGVSGENSTQNSENNAQNSETGIQETAQTQEAAVNAENAIIFAQSGQEMNYFCIPLHTEVKAENVAVENHYMDKELWVSISQVTETKAYEDFYQTQGVYGNRNAVMDGYYESGEDTFWLKFHLNDVYEYHSIFEDGKLYIEFVPPKEVYDRIVVIDPAYGADETGAVSGDLEGKNITIEIARALKKKLDETDIKVYYTRMDDSNPSEENRIGLTNAARADMLIRIEVNENEDTKIYGTEAVYNSKFFIPGFGSIELADLLEREVVTAISGKANGLVESAEEDAVINQATVPAATIRVGYVSNGQEAILLNREDYVEKIATGIYQAIMTAYEN